MIIHLGDCWGDASRLQKEFPDLPMERVPGNCDYVQEPLSRILQIEGFDVLISHGHLYYVKTDLLRFQYKAQENKVQLALFGHTHKVYYDRHNGVTYLNPGSIGAPGYKTSPSYGIMLLDGERHHMEVEVKYIEF